MPTVNKHFVAVITPLYNDAGRIIRAIETVRSQTYKNYVHFIFDDGSTDSSRNVVHEYIANNPASHIVFASLDENIGQSCARNMLIARASLNSPEYFAFLDSDDYWTPTHLEESIKAINEQKLDMVYSIPYFVDDNNTPLFAYKMRLDQEPTYTNLSQANSIHISSVVMKKICVETVGNFDSSLNSIEDWDFWVRTAKAGFKIGRITDPSVYYLIRTDGMASKADDDKVKKLKDKHMIEDIKPIKLNLGCGDEILEGYINCDMDSAGADMLFDAAVIPFPDNSVDEIRAYHLIEHFPFQKGLLVLKEWFRALKPNGRLVMETPDLLNTCKKFVEVDEQTRIVLYGHFFAWPDLSPWQTHYFLFTETQMRWSLESIGFKTVQRVPPDSIYARCNPSWQDLYMKVEAYKPEPIFENKPQVYDAFLFFNELDLLEIRLNELNDTVDKFVLVESDTTFTGKPKPYYYNENKERYKEFHDKIIHVMVTNSPNTGSPWDAEAYQRDSIYRGLQNCRPNDIVLISDVDEIPNLDAIQSYNPINGVSLLQQRTSFYYMNCVSNLLWWNAKIGSWRDVSKETASQIRSNNNRPVIEEGGWHFTGLGGVEAILKKLDAFSHIEYNTNHFRNKELLEIKIKNGWDIYDRIGAIATYWDINDIFPKYIIDNKEKLTVTGYIRDTKMPELPLSEDKYKRIDELNHSLYDEIFQQGGYMMFEDDIMGKVFVDVGANIGVTTIKALSLGAKKVLAFEPESTNYKTLIELTKEYDNVNVYHHAVYDSARTIQITNEGITSNIFNSKPEDEWAPTLSLGEITNLLQDNEEAVLKLDCEGAEFHIIYKSSKEVVQRFDMIFFEIHNDLAPDYIGGDLALIEYMETLGFACEKLPFISGIWYPDGTFSATANSFYKCKNKNKTIK